MFSKSEIVFGVGLISQTCELEVKVSNKCWHSTDDTSPKQLIYNAYCYIFHIVRLSAGAFYRLADSSVYILGPVHHIPLNKHASHKHCTIRSSDEDNELKTTWQTPIFLRDISS